MANNYTQQFYNSYVRNLTAFHGSVNIASGTVGVSASNIVAATVARTGVGEITVTLDKGYPACVGAHFTILSATAQDLVPQIKSVDVVTQKKIVVNLLADAAPTDPTSAITLFIDIKVRNSSVNP